MTTFPRILSPLRVGSVMLPNRMVMGAMHTRIETLDRAMERLAAFYASRAAGEVGLILTGGFSPVPEGVMDEGGPLFNSRSQLHEHSHVTKAVHQAGGRIALQILHAGRYARVTSCVSASPGKARINVFSPRPLSTEEVWQTIESFAYTAMLAKEAGYDGVEIMGSEGYLITQFTAANTNQREDEFGGDFDGRVRLPLKIISAVRERVRDDFMIIYRISSIDLMEGGMTGPEIAEFARRVEQAGADMINTGVGWHESAVPTIAASVPRAAWSAAARNVKQAVSIPVIASNRINMPDVAEDIIASGCADLVSMARPLLADPDFAKKTRLGLVDEINTCIACNQACLDRIFTDRTATCLVNPRAGREIEFSDGQTGNPQRLAVVGAGPAGMSFAVNAARRGHEVTLFDSGSEIGGQLGMAKKIPGKSEFNELLRYFRVSLEKLSVDVRLGRRVEADELCAGGFDVVIVATGVTPRTPDFPGVDHPTVISYYDVLAHGAPVGKRVAIIGAGGIGFDVAEYLLGRPEESVDTDEFLAVWGVDPYISTRGGLTSARLPASPKHAVHMFQRKDESLGRNLGKSTGWILKSKLRKANVEMTHGVTYNDVDDYGLHFTANGTAQALAFDTIILCAGQNSNRILHEELLQRGVKSYVIGGADVAVELDAVRAIDQATRLAMSF